MIYLDLTIFRFQNIGGISVVWAEYLKRLREHSTLPVTLLMPAHDNAIARETDLSAYPHAATGARTSATKFLPYLRRGQPDDVLHTSYYQWYPLFRGTQIVTLHDFMHEMFAPLKARLLHNALKYLSLRSADVVLCIFETTRSDFERLYPRIYRRKTVHVIENAASEQFFPEPGATAEPYLLWVAGRGGYKNFDFALTVLAQLNASGRRFVLRVVGPQLSASERASAQSKGVADQVETLSGVSTGDLRRLYSNAFALLYLSRYEGFGLPVLEAQQCGCPVIALNNPASREVGASSVMFLEDGVASGVEDFVAALSDSDQRASVVAAGFDNAKRYSWDRSVAKLAAVYAAHQSEAQE